MKSREVIQITAVFSQIEKTTMNHAKYLTGRFMFQITREISPCHDDVLFVQERLEFL